MHSSISIITPSFNQGHFIEETICSVLDQQYPNLQYIIIDGGSTDNSVEIIRKYEKHLHYWVSEKDSGQSDAINKGVAKATGEVINWLNSDDYYMPGALKLVGQAFEDKGVNVFCGKSRIFGHGLERISTGTDIYEGDLAKTIGWARIDQPETFFRRAAWDVIGGIDEQFHYLMDREFWIRYLCVYGLNNIQQSQEVLVNFRLHDNSKTISQQQGFEKEAYSYIYSFAKYFNLEVESKAIVEFYPNATWLNIIPVKMAAVDARKIIHYFFWHRMAEAYAQNDDVAYKYFCNIIDKNCLMLREQSLFEKVKFRKKWLPAAMINILRKR